MKNWIIGTTLMTGLALLCSCGEKSIPIQPLSQEQQQHKKDIDRCYSLMVQAGAKWYQGDQVGDICKRQNPTPPERARAKIIAHMKKSGLIPVDTNYTYQLIDGDCKLAADRYIELHNKAFLLNESNEKQRTLADALEIFNAAIEGKCLVKSEPSPRQN